jgi:hypothetical protein
MRLLKYTVALLLALGFGIALGALVISDDDDPAEVAAPSTTVVDAPPPELKPGAAERVATNASHGFSSAQPITREVTVSGSTYAWNGGTGLYEPTGSFQRQALLVIDTDGNFGIFAGSIGDASPGQIWFATNSSVYRLIQGPAASVYLSQIPVANVAESNGGQTLQATVNTNARTVQVNSFAVAGQFEPKQILSGTMQVNLSSTGASGTIDLYGGGYIEPGNSFPVDLYRATFSG